MRNNQDRLTSNQLHTQDSDVEAVRSPFNYVVPTQLVDLPSKGAYYPPEHPLHGKESAEIKEMTAREEDILYNKSFLEKGIVMDRLLQSILVDKRIDPTSLLVIDKNALLLAARISGYGPEYPIKAECSSCGSSFDTEVDLSTLLKIKEPELKEGCRLLENGLVEVVLPVTKWKIEVKPLDGYEQEKLQKILEGRKKHKLEENTLIETAKTFIYSINGVSEENIIYQAIMSMPARDSKFLRNVYAECFPNITTNTVVTCTVCQNETDMEVPFNVNFFWSK